MCSSCQMDEGSLLKQVMHIYIFRGLTTQKFEQLKNNTTQLALILQTIPVCS